MSVNNIYRSDELFCQADPLLELGLDRSSLDRLRNIIVEIRRSEGNDVAYEVTRWLADPITLSQFINGRAVNLFRNALQRKPRADLFEHHIGPHLYHLGSYYMYKPDLSRFGQEPGIGVEHTLERLIHWIVKSPNTTKPPTCKLTTES